MAKKKEFPSDDWVFKDPEKSLYKIRPTSEIESLMQLAPHREAILPSIESTQAVKEIVGKIIDDLSDEDRWIFNALVVGRLSLRGAGRILGIPKTSLARRRDKIRRELMAKLIKCKPIQEWLER